MIEAILALSLDLGCVDLYYKECVQIDISSRRLTYYEDKIPVLDYPVAVGKRNTPTPTGNFYVFEKSNKTSWRNRDGSTIPYNSRRNPMLGIYAGIGILEGVPLGIHATNSPSSVGTASSGGCIRLYESDMKHLYSLLFVGIPVLIR